MNTKLFIISLSLGIALSQSVTAVPLLRQSKTNSIDDLATIYPDHQDANQHYFLPNKGGFAKTEDGLPLFGLVVVDKGEDSKSSGWLTFTLEASITKNLRAQLQQIRDENPNAKLTVVPFGKSSLSIGSAYQFQPGAELPEEAKAQIPDPAKQPPPSIRQVDQSGLAPFFKSIYLPPYAGVAETQLGVNAVLTKDGAEMFRAGIENPQLMSMFLCYQVYGALPVMHAKITMNYQKIYNYFAASASGGWAWFGWTLSHVVEKLIEDRSIQIEILGGDAKMDDYVRLYAEELAKTYLVEKISNSPAATNYIPTNLITFGFNSAHKEQRSTVTWELKKQQFITDDRCVGISLSGLSPYKDKIVKVVRD